MNNSIHWMKLPINFFEQLPIRKLGSSKNGDSNIIAYQKILLTAIKNEGFISYEGIEENPTEELCTLTGKPVEFMESLLSKLEKLKLLNKIYDTEQNFLGYYLVNACYLFGSESHSAARKRQQRKIENLKTELARIFPEAKVTLDSEEDSNKRKREPEVDQEREADFVFSPTTIKITHDVITFLNSRTGSTYPVDDKLSYALIDELLKKGFTMEDFLFVIELKSAEWLSNPRTSPWLRPQTLFGVNFETYRCQPMALKKDINPDKKGKRNIFDDFLIN